MIRDALWFGLATLAIPTLLDAAMLRTRWWLKYKSEKPRRRTVSALNAYFEALDELERLQASIQSYKR